mgnify:CR=1 FL=1
MGGGGWRGASRGRPSSPEPSREGRGRHRSGNGKHTLHTSADPSSGWGTVHKVRLSRRDCVEGLQGGRCDLPCAGFVGSFCTLVDWSNVPQGQKDRMSRGGVRSELWPRRLPPHQGFCCVGDDTERVTRLGYLSLLTHTHTLCRHHGPYAQPRVCTVPLCLLFASLSFRLVFVVKVS